MHEGAYPKAQLQSANALPKNLSGSMSKTCLLTCPSEEVKLGGVGEGRVVAEVVEESVDRIGAQSVEGELFVGGVGGKAKREAGGVEVDRLPS